MSKIFSLTAVQQINSNIDKVWDFFSDSKNLKDITPAHLGFKIISESQSDTMYAGQIIEYYVKPVLNIPLYWMTEITHVKEKEYFVDEQRFGPYSFWHHQHHFKIIDGGVKMNDTVHYKIPFWFLGDIANTLFVRKQLEKIFQFRQEAVEKKFGKWNEIMR